MFVKPVPIPLHPTGEAVLDALSDLTLSALAAAVADQAAGVTAELAVGLDVSGADARSPLERVALLDAARREAEIFGDNYVRCEYLLFGALRMLGDEDRLYRAREDFQILTADRLFDAYAALTPHPRPAGAPRPSLVMLTGLPGTGKSTLAEALARALPASVFSMDWQLGTLVRFGVLRPDNTGPMSELMLAAAAARQLQLGLPVVVDATGHRRKDRERLADLAHSLDTRFVGVECLCSDEEVQRARLAGRDRGIPGWKSTVSWEHVKRMQGLWEPWEELHLALDSAVLTAADSLQQVLEVIANGE